MIHKGYIALIVVVVIGIYYFISIKKDGHFKGRDISREFSNFALAMVSAIQGLLDMLCWIIYFIYSILKTGFSAFFGKKKPQSKKANKGG